MGKFIKLDKIFKTRKPSITFGRPIARSPKWENQIKFQVGVTDLASRGYGIYPDDFLSMEWWGNTVASSRNKIVKATLMRKSDYLFFIDDDMTCNNFADDVEKMIEADKDIIGGISPTKGRPHWPNISKVLHVGQHRTICDSVLHRIYDYPEDKQFQVDIVGTSYMLIKRKVLDKMAGPWFYMPPDYEHLDIKGEDSTFCFNAKMYGFEIWVDPTIMVPHIGDNGWQLHARSTCYDDFKEILIKDSNEALNEKLTMCGLKEPKPHFDYTHNLLDDVQAIMREGKGPGKMFV